MGRISQRGDNLRLRRSGQNMQNRQPTKDEMIAGLRRIAAAAPDGRASLAVFKKETGWDRYWFDKHWPAGGYRAACEEVGIKPGAIIGIEAYTRVTDEDLALRFAETVHSIGKIPPLKRFIALTRMGMDTILRGDTYEDAKRRIIVAYFELPPNARNDDEVEKILRDELRRLDGQRDELQAIPPLRGTVAPTHAIDVPATYIELVRDFRDRGEEEKRQLVAQFFYQVLGYRRARVRSEHKHNDVRVHDRRDEPWLVVEVKPLLETERDRRAARRQGFDYAHRLGMRFVVISDGDFYEVFDRYGGKRLRYDEMRQGSFQISSLRSRDNDLLAMLASER